MYPKGEIQESRREWYEWEFRPDVAWVRTSPIDLRIQEMVAVQVVVTRDHRVGQLLPTPRIHKRLRDVYQPQCDTHHDRNDDKGSFPSLPVPWARLDRRTRGMS